MDQKYLRKKMLHVADVYCVVKPMMVVSVMNMNRFFLSLTKHYNYLHNIYTVLDITSSIEAT